MIDISSCIPEMKTGRELVNALRILPEYDPDICSRNTSARLIALSDIYKIYVPSEMSVEVYNKLYLALLRSLQKKYTRMATLQQKENFKAIRQQEYDSIIGGSDSFTIIGTSGIGKSSAVSRAVSLIAEKPVISLSVPHTKIIPCITVQCPWDSSVKGLLLEILRKVDELLGSKYYSNAIRARATTDMLIGSVSQVALNHIGLLIVDEIQNICTGRNGKGFVGMLTQLINNSGISIAMVGTPESTVLPYCMLCRQMWHHQLHKKDDMQDMAHNQLCFLEKQKKLSVIVRLLKKLRVARLVRLKCEQRRRRIHRQPGQSAPQRHTILLF